MKWLRLLGLGILCTHLFACAGETPQAGEVATEEPAGGTPAEPEWVTLLDGSTLEGWDIVGDSNWMVGDGFVESSSGQTGYLVTPESYADFELSVEFWVDEIANSGVFIRCSDTSAISDRTAYEVNIYDTRPDQTYRTAAIVNFAPPAQVIDVGGQWNTFEIRAEGGHLQVSLNGTETVDIEDTTYSEGPVALQYGAGTVRFRSVRIRPL